jgi:hypothetical protein
VERTTPMQSSAALCALRGEMLLLLPLSLSQDQPQRTETGPITEQVRPLSESSRLAPSVSPLFAREHEPILEQR